MQKLTKSYFYLCLTASIEGIGLIILAVILELLVRLGIYINFLNSGLEWLVFKLAMPVGVLVIVYELLVLYLKIRKYKKRKIE